MSTRDETLDSIGRALDRAEWDRNEAETILLDLFTTADVATRNEIARDVLYGLSEWHEEQAADNSQSAENLEHRRAAKDAYNFAEANYTEG